MKIKLKLAAVLFAAALTVVGVLQYRWFSSSAASELDRVHKSIVSTVFRAAYREYERYGTLLRELQGLTDLPPENLTLRLNDLYRQYGPEGSVPFLIAGAGYYSGDTWVSVAGESLPSAEKPPADFPGWGMEEDFLVYNMGSRRLSLIFRLPGGTGLLAVLLLDLEGFTEAYLKPSITEALPEYELRWFEVAGEESRPDLRGGFGLEDYRFRLLPAMFGRSSLELNPPVIPISPFIDWRGAPDQPPGENRPPILPGFRSASRQDTLYVQVGLPEAQFSLNVERNLALTWLGSIILLAGMGAAFLLLLYQVNRIRSLREREREFVATVSHELRTPLTVIHSAAENLSNEKIPAQRIAAYGPLIREQTGRLSAMIEEMLIFSGMEGNSEKMKPVVPVRFDEFFERLKKVLEEAISKKSISLTWDTGGLPASCMADPEALRLMLENLVLNAVHHAYSDAPGNIRISARLTSPKTLVFMVEDDGRGVDPAEQKHVFEPFYRDRVSREKQERGSGLGLFIASRKARLHGGDLTLESPYERIDGTKKAGCRFILTLPYRPVGKEEAHAPGTDY
ncbi:MAG: HAMP domain-containing histidine kinase [Spirochaetales bacterium]|nr:HAMP domain-containing histidine kinase [Spirochaetales bacterium]